MARSLSRLTMNCSLVMGSEPWKGGALIVGCEREFAGESDGRALN